MSERIRIGEIDLKDKFNGKFTFGNLKEFDPKHLFNLPFSRVVSTYKRQGRPDHVQEYLIEDNSIEYTITDEWHEYYKKRYLYY